MPGDYTRFFQGSWQSLKHLACPMMLRFGLYFSLQAFCFFLALSSGDILEFAIQAGWATATWHLLIITLLLLLIISPLFCWSFLKLMVYLASFNINVREVFFCQTPDFEGAYQFIRQKRLGLFIKVLLLQSLILILPSMLTLGISTLSFTGLDTVLVSILSLACCVIFNLVALVALFTLIYLYQSVALAKDAQSLGAICQDAFQHFRYGWGLSLLSAGLSLITANLLIPIPLIGLGRWLGLSNLLDHYFSHVLEQLGAGLLSRLSEPGIRLLAQTLSDSLISAVSSGFLLILPIIALTQAYLLIDEKIQAKATH